MFRQLILMILAASITLVVFNSCESSIQPEKTELNSRNYTWTVDTLNAPDNSIYYLKGIWGDNNQNVWVVGSGGTPYNFWHYNGEKWYPFPFKKFGNFIRIFGLSESNIWSVGTGIIQHFNGFAWEPLSDILYPNAYATFYTDVWGTSNENIFFVGGVTEDLSSGNYFGLISHYDGSTFRFLDIPKIRVGFSQVRYKEQEPNILYLKATRFESTGDTNKIFQYDGDNLKLIWSGREVSTVNEMNGEIYFAIGPIIYKYNNETLNIWKDFSNTTYLGRVWGRNENDFFGVAKDGLAHYNGIDLQIIYPTDLFINELLVTGKDVFMLCEHRIIIHGKLRN